MEEDQPPVSSSSPPSENGRKAKKGERNVEGKRWWKGRRGRVSGSKGGKERREGEYSKRKASWKVRNERHWEGAKERKREGGINTSLPLNYLEA